MRYHHLPTKTAAVKKQQGVLGSMWRAWSHCALPVGMQSGSAPVEDSMTVLKKVGMELP